MKNRYTHGCRIFSLLILVFLLIMNTGDVNAAMKVDKSNKKWKCDSDFFRTHTLINHPDGQLESDFDRIGEGFIIQEVHTTFKGNRQNKSFWSKSDKKYRNRKEKDVRYDILEPSRYNPNYILETELKQFKWGMSQEQILGITGAAIDTSVPGFTELNEKNIFFDTYLAGYDVKVFLSLNDNKLHSISFYQYLEKSEYDQASIENIFGYLQSELTKVYGKFKGSEGNLRNADYKIAFAKKKTGVLLKVEDEGEKYKFSLFAYERK